MTIHDMRVLLGLGLDVTDADVIAAYGAYLADGTHNLLPLDAAKAHLRVDGDDEDDLISACVVAATDYIERNTGVLLTRRVVTETLRSFNDYIRAWPVAAIISVTYADWLYVDQPLDLAIVRANILRRPVRLFAGSSWPRTAMTAAPITVVVDAGFSSPAAVPGTIMQALKLLVGHFYTNRLAVEVQAAVVAAEVPYAVDMLLRPHRLRVL